MCLNLMNHESYIALVCVESSAQFISNAWKNACNAFLWFKYASGSVHAFACKQVEAIQRKYIAIQ